MLIIRLLSARIGIVVLFIFSASSALALGADQTLEDWRLASYGERVALADQFSRVAGRLNVSISRDEIAACIDQVAASSALASQRITEVAKACLLTLAR